LKASNLNSPTIGLLVPVYTEPAYLAALLSTLVGQLDDLNELVFVDDANCEPVPRMLAKFAELDPAKITVLTNTIAMGISASTSLGLKRIKSDYVAFVDSDDLITSNAFSTVASEILANPGVSVISSRFSFLLNTGKVIPRARDESGDDWRLQIISDNFISHLKVVSKEVLGRMQWSPEIDGVQDAVLNFCLDSKDSVVLLPDYLYLHRVHDQQHSNSLSSSASRALNLSRRNWMLKNLPQRSCDPTQLGSLIASSKLKGFPRKSLNYLLSKPSVFVMPIGSSAGFQARLGKLENFTPEPNHHILIQFKGEAETFTKSLARICLSPAASLGLYVPEGRPMSLHLAKVFSGLFDYLLVDNQVVGAILRGDVPDEIPIIVRTDSIQ
jgi:glycosyltransferase involved in cell wall biosynthesis